MSSTIPGRTSGFVQPGPNTDMRSFVAASVMLASLACAGAATAAECPPGAMGVSRTIVVDPAEHQLLGSQQYRESLPLRDKEVVLTFDDGPLPPYTNRILDTLASECVKATFFLVGRMVRGYPSIVRRIYNDGHTIANHSQNHPFTFHKMTVEQASTEIEDGFESLRSVLGNPKAVSPFFRIPGLLRQPSVEQYLSSRNYMTWSVDFLADDWTRISASEVASRAISRMEAHRKGILLLHDIQPATALAFPEILSELKARGYKIVHVVPATPDRPKTVTAPEQWAARGAAPEQKVWPRVVSVNTAALSNAEPKLAVPSAASLGLSSPLAPVTSIAMVPNLERAHGAGRRRAAAAGAAVAALDLCGAGRHSGSACAGCADDAIHPRVPDARDGKEEDCGRGHAVCEAEGPQRADRDPAQHTRRAMSRRCGLRSRSTCCRPSCAEAGGSRTSAAIDSTTPGDGPAFALRHDPDTSRAANTADQIMVRSRVVSPLRHDSHLRQGAGF